LSGLLLFISGSVALGGGKDEAGLNQLAFELLIAGRLVSGIGCGALGPVQPFKN
jgi:MFS family permease